MDSWKRGIQKEKRNEKKKDKNKLPHKERWVCVKGTREEGRKEERKREERKKIYFVVMSV